MIDINKLSGESRFIYECRDPFFYIKKMWGITPQPPKEEFAEFIATSDPREWKAEHFGDSERIELENGRYYMRWTWADENGNVVINTREKFLANNWITWQQSAILTTIKLHTESLGDEVSLKQFLGWLSVVSGHGIGKTAVLSWIILWFLFVFRNCQVAATAPSKQQIYDVLWKEVNVWLSRLPSVYKDLYEWQGTYVRMRESPEVWFARAATARKENPEALAGIHAEDVLLLVDEGSGVEEPIYQTAEGVATGEHVMFVIISNGTRNTGYFRDTHRDSNEGWVTFSFNCEESPVVKEDYLRKQAESYDREDDNYRVRVLGLFPHEDVMDDKGYMPLISEKDLKDAFVPKDTIFKALKMGVDPAGGGGDPATWVGLNTSLLKILNEEKISTPTSGATKTLTMADEHDLAGKHIILDSFGIGASWLPYINQGGKMVGGINSGLPSANKDYLNLRAEGAWKFRLFLKRGGQLVYDARWKEVLNIKYRRMTNGKIQIMPKLEMKKNKIPSPNIFDAACYSFLGEEVGVSAKQEAIDDEIAKYERIALENQLKRFN